MVLKYLALTNILPKYDLYGNIVHWLPMLPLTSAVIFWNLCDHLLSQFCTGCHRVPTMNILRLDPWILQDGTETKHPKTSFPSNFRVWSQFQWQKITLFCCVWSQDDPIVFFSVFAPKLAPWEPLLISFSQGFSQSIVGQLMVETNYITKTTSWLSQTVLWDVCMLLHIYMYIYIYVYCIHILGRTWALHSHFLSFLTLFHHHLTQCGPSFIKTFNFHQFPNAVLLDHLWWKNHHQRHHNGIHTDHRSISDVLE